MNSSISMVRVHFNASFPSSSFVNSMYCRLSSSEPLTISSFGTSSPVSASTFTYLMRWPGRPIELVKRDRLGFRGRRREGDRAETCRRSSDWLPTLIRPAELAGALWTTPSPRRGSVPAKRRCGRTKFLSICSGWAVGAAIIAEGMETEPQREFLAAIGCQIAQDYLFSRPMPAAEVDRVLA